MARPCASRCAWRVIATSALLVLAAAARAPPADAAPDPAAPGEALNIGLLRGPGMPGTQVDLYLEVVLNGLSTGRVVHVPMRADKRLFAWPANLRDAGLQTAGLPDDQYVDLALIPGLSYSYDPLNQRISFSAAPERLQLPTQRLNPPVERRYAAAVSPGVLLNYDVYALSAEGGSRSLSGLSELRVFGDWGVASSTGLSAYTNAGGEQHPYIRLDTAWTRSFPDALLSVTAGDFISGSLSWSRPTRLGGLQLRRNFALAPELVTFPLPAFFGQAALPSAVELYVNGVRQYSGSVPPGPFELTAPPSVDGAGRAQVLIVDALGRRSLLNFAYYSANRLLRAGLSDWSVEFGSVRRDYGLDSFDYRSRPALSGSLRQGWRDWLTLETHAEAAEGLALGGGGAVLRAGEAGLFSAALAASAGEGEGGLGSLGYSWVGGGFNAELSHTRSSRGYRDIASLGGRPPPRRSERALAGVVLGGAGSVSLSYTRFDATDEEPFRLLGLNYALGLPWRLNLFASLTHDLDRGDTAVFAGLAGSLAGGRSGGLSLQHGSEGGTVLGADLSQPLRPEGGLGWSLRAQRGAELEAYQAEAAWRDDWGQVSAGGSAVDDQHSAYAGASGGVVWMDRDWFITRRADDAFVLVSTGGVADVPVRLENRVIGRTDAEGHYLVTGLNAWQPNRLSIDLLGLPAQVRADAVQKQAVPADRSGLTLEFGLHESRVALVTLVDGQGRALPLGSRVHREGAVTGAAIVGYDGLAYLEDLTQAVRLSVVTPAGEVCEAAFQLPAAAAGIPAIGPLKCR